MHLIKTIQCDHQSHFFLVDGSGVCVCARAQWVRACMCVNTWNSQFAPVRSVWRCDGRGSEMKGGGSEMKGGGSEMKGGGSEMKEGGSLLTVGL